MQKGGQGGEGKTCRRRAQEAGGTEGLCYWPFCIRACVILSPLYSYCSLGACLGGCLEGCLEECLEGCLEECLGGCLGGWVEEQGLEVYHVSHMCCTSWAACPHGLFIRHWLISLLPLSCCNFHSLPPPFTSCDAAGLFDDPELMQLFSVSRTEQCHMTVM